MRHSNKLRLFARSLRPALIPMWIVLVLILLGTRSARAGEIIPSIGMTRAINGDAPATACGGLALRENILPFLKSEIGVSYRSEKRNSGQLTVREWPVTTSLWFSPLSALYAGGGVGWYHTTLDYAATSLYKNETSQKFGVHLGGGLSLPLGPSTSLDLNGRYVFMNQQRSQLPPNHFNPDYWNTSVGLAFHF